MDEINYIPTDTYFGNSINENVTITNNEYEINSEENISNNQSEHEIDIKDLLISNYEKRNEISKQKPKLDINTMESIRISHSFERSKNSQSLTQIINKPFILMQNNTNDDDCYNQTFKFKNSNNSMEISSSMTNKCFYYNDSNEEKNSLISINDKKSLNENHVSILNQDFFNENKNNQNKNDKDNNYDINNNCLKRCKIGNIFKEIFEERIKSNKLSENDSLKKMDSEKNKNKIKQKLLGYKTKENYYLSLFDSDKYSSSNTKKSSIKKIKDKELTIEINNSNKEKYEKDNLIDLNSIDNKALIISNFNNTNEYNIKNQEKLDYLKNKNKCIIKEKKNRIILYAFENENKNENDGYNKNVMISELDIKIPKALPEEENKNNNFSNKKKEIPKSINNECIKEKHAIINSKTLNTDFNKDKRRRNNIIKYIYKKTFKFEKIPVKKICSHKSIKNVNKSIKRFKSIKGKKGFNFENDILKKYKNNSPFSNYHTKTIITKQNNLNTSRSNCSFFALNTKILKRINININNRTLTSEIIRKNFSRCLNTSSSLPKNKKIKAHYLNYLSKKSNILLKNNYVNRNKYFSKKDNENNINQNNDTKDTKEKTSTNTIENKCKIINCNKLSKVNTSFLNKMNRAKDFTIFTKINNSHFNKIMNNSHKKNPCKNDKNNSKKKEIHLYSINKYMMLFKGEINRIKQNDLYPNKTKLLKRKNLNNFTKEIIYRNQNEQSNQTERPLFKNIIKIKNINNVSNTLNQNINLYKCKKPVKNINNNCSNSLLLTNINNNKGSLNHNKYIKKKENIITEFKPIIKYNTYNINHSINFKESKSKTNTKTKIINDVKLTNKANITYVKNLIEKNNLLNIKTMKKNASELKYKINNILISMNNNSHNNILQKNKYPFSCKNKIKKNLTFKFE